MPSSQPNPIAATTTEELVRILNYLVKDIYSNLDTALQLDGKGVIVRLNLGGLGKDVSAFDGLVRITGGISSAITVGAGLEIASAVLKVKQQAVEADVAAITALTIPTGVDHVNLASFQTLVNTMITEMNAVKTKVNNILAKLRLSEELAT